MNNFWEIYDLKETINISDNKELRLAFVKKDNTIGIDIRTFYQKSGKWNPGKGLVIPANKWEEFQNCINNINK